MNERRSSDARAARRRGRRRLAVALAAVAGLGVFAYLAVAAIVGGLSSASGVHTGSGAAHGATIVRWKIRSRFVHRTLPVTAALPAGAGSGRPLLVFLHGRGSNGNESNANSQFMAALAAQGARAPAVVFPNGGEASYFHARASGRWDRYVLDEVIPQALRRLHADPSRIAIGGISMGGFGAYDLARLRPKLFCAVGGHSAAMWLAAGDTPAGAFDDAADFGRNDVVAIARARGRAAWGHAALWLDGGTADPFRAADERLAAALGIRMRHYPGGHNGTYWRAHYGTYLRWYTQALARC